MGKQSFLRIFSVVAAMILTALIVSSAWADMPALESGAVPDVVTDGGVNTLNGQLFATLPLPILSPQRGGHLDFNFLLTANSVPWSVRYNTASNAPSSCVAGTTNCTWTNSLGRAQTIGNMTGGVGLARGWDISLHRTTTTQTVSNNESTTTDETETNHYLITSDGAVHHLQDISPHGDFSYYAATDGSAYQVHQSNPDSLGVFQSAVILDRQGNQFAAKWGTAGTASCLTRSTKSGSPPFITVTTTTVCDSFTSTSQITDANGNVYTLVGPSGSAGTDTKGQTPPTEVTPGTANTAACQSVAGLAIASTSAFAYMGYGGSAQTVTECFSNYTLQTGFGQSGVNEFPATVKALMVTAILPDGTKYTFDYDAYGNLTYIGLPKGGNIRYAWETVNFGIGGCGNAAQLSRAVQSRTVDDNNGHAYTTNYSWGALQSDGTLTNTVTDATGNDTAHIFSIYANASAGGVSGATGCQGLVETSTQEYQGAGSNRVLLEKTDIVYSAATTPAEATSDAEIGPFVGNVFATAITTTDVVANRVKRVVRTPDTGFGAGKPILGQTLKELAYDWGAGSPGPLVKETDSAFQWQTDSRYLTAGLLDLQTSEIGKDGAGNEIARTDIQYDAAASLASSGITLQHVAPPNPVRGNLSQVSRWLSTASAPSGAGTPINSPVIHPVIIFDTGMVFQDEQPANANNRTTFKYDATGTYVVETDLPNTTDKNILPGEPTVSHVAKAGYDFNTGLVTSATDQNGKVTTYGFQASNDFPASTNYPDGGSTNYGYFSSGTSDEVDNQIDATRHTAYSYQIDGLGRKYAEHRNTGQGFVHWGVSSFDAFGRPTSVSNPMFTTGDPTLGETGYLYDALGRVTQVTKPDADANGHHSVAITSYSQTVSGVGGICTIGTDEAGKKREACADALGRPTSVFEDPNGLRFETDYVYSTDTGHNNNQLVTITQKGRGGTAASQYRVHSATYDSLGRLLSATNPETGTIAYTYDNDGNVLTKTDSRNIQASYTYDELDRLLLVTYNDGKTLGTFYLYDYSNPEGVAISNPVGRLVASSTLGSRWTFYSYDPMGRVMTYTQCSGKADGTPDTTNCASSEASYDFIGDLTSISAPDGLTISYTYDVAGWVQTAKDNNGFIYASSVSYAPNGSVASIVTPNFSYNYAYNNRFQPTNVSIGSAVQSLLDNDYSYNPGSDNGDVTSVHNNNGWLTRSVGYGYDAVNRLISAQSASANCTPSGTTSCPASGAAWADSYSYDDWGNLTAKTITGQSGENLSATVGANNQISSYVNQAGTTLTPHYDAAGNIINDGVTSYTFDAWNRITAEGSNTYVYGPSGERWSKSAGSNVPAYFYGPSGQVVEDEIGGWHTYVYLGGMRLAEVEYNGVSPYNVSGWNIIHYYLADPLGTTQDLVDKDGKTVLDAQAFYPFGGVIPGVGSASSTNRFKFTGQERDPESGLDYFGARYYNSTLGRWMSADWSAAPAAIPYAHAGDPQTYNLYSYVRGNPTSLVDGDGHGFVGLSGLGGGLGRGISIFMGSDDNFEGSVDNLEIVDMTDQVTAPSVINPPLAPVPDLQVPLDPHALDDIANANDGSAPQSGAADDGDQFLVTPGGPNYSKHVWHDSYFSLFSGLTWTENLYIGFLDASGNTVFSEMLITKATYNTSEYFTGATIEYSSSSSPDMKVIANYQGFSPDAEAAFRATLDNEDALNTSLRQMQSAFDQEKVNQGIADFFRKLFGGGH